MPWHEAIRQKVSAARPTLNAYSANSFCLRRELRFVDLRPNTAVDSVVVLIILIVAVDKHLPQFPHTAIHVHFNTIIMKNDWLKS